MKTEQVEDVNWRTSPQRFHASKATLLFDRLMTWFIKCGGVLVIAAVLGICVFIFSQIVPLFRTAEVKEYRSIQLPSIEYHTLGMDEWSEMAFAVEPNGKLLFIDLVHGTPPQEAALGLPENIQVSAANYNPGTQQLVFGTGDGKFTVVDVRFSRATTSSGDRVEPTASAGPLYQIGPGQGVIRQIGFGDSGSDKLAVAIIEVNGQPQLHAATLKQTRSLMGAGKISVGDQFDLTAKVTGRPVRILVNRLADTILVSTDDGNIHYLERRGSSIEAVQVIQPFGDLPQQQIASLDFLLGDVSISVTNSEGVHRVFSLFFPGGGLRRLFAQTKEFPPLPGPVHATSASVRNRAFLVASGSTASLRYSTNASVRWEQQFDYLPKHVLLGTKYDKVVLLDDKNVLHLFKLNDPHPESSWSALFGKVWYDGYAKPGYEWQSTGGADDFEPKISMIPLITGTLKGTLYAMLFSVPIALLAAIYASQFLDPNVRRVVKPVMEIMASLPSVVLGFLAALWLAPILETRMPSFIAAVVVVPVTAVLFGWLWAGLPIRYRVLVRPGCEFIAFLPVLLLGGWLAWQTGPWLERTLFSFTDPGTGNVVADFRRWWPHVTGLAFEQRNALIVGIMMGFAVIPIIFTITEDALSNVPMALRSASLALGASRWQTTLRVVLPTASAGIFSAVMIGLGRAVGETMIVVMATGNTPLMSFNIFSGMRTLSANIAVELPEAPHLGTLYRVLFLGAFLLFLLTFVINTVAELMRQHLREKYKTV